MGSYLVCLVTKEMNLLKLLVFHKTQSKGLVPAIREDIKRDLTANGVGKTIIWEFLLQDLYHFGSVAHFLQQS